MRTQQIDKLSAHCRRLIIPHGIDVLELFTSAGWGLFTRLHLTAFVFSNFHSVAAGEREIPHSIFRPWSGQKWTSQEIRSNIWIIL